MSLITIAQAKGHLRLDIPTTPTPDPADADILLKMAQAERLVLNYCNVDMGSPFPWTNETNTPAEVQAAILMVFGELYRFRGDDPGTIMSAPARDPGHALSPVVEGMLAHYHDPVLA